MYKHPAKKRGISFTSSCSLRFSLATCFGRFITDFVDGRLMTAMAVHTEATDDSWRYFTES